MKLGPVKEEVRQPQTLVDFYLDGNFTRLYADLSARPDHYDDRQKHIIRCKYMNQPCHPEPTAEEINGLVMQLVRATDVEMKHRKILEQLQNKTKPFDIGDTAELLGADGQPVPAFEEQGFEDLISIEDFKL